MTTQEITLNLPELIYDQIRQAAEKSHHSIDDVIIEAVIAAAPTLVLRNWAAVGWHPPAD